MITNKSSIVIWIVFWFIAILTWLVDAMLWMVKWQWFALLILGLCSVIISIKIFATTGFTRRSMVLVVAGLLLGQWWLIELLIVQVIWHTVGFAP